MAKEKPDVLTTLTALCGGVEEQTSNDEFISSGSVIFDAVLSNGRGIPRGKFIQLTSESGLGKSTMALHFCKSLCLKGYLTLYLDSEKSVNQSQLEGVGLDKYLGSQFFLKKVGTFEEVEEILDSVLIDNDDKLALIILDSITALVPQKMIDNSIGSNEPGLHARMVTQFLIKYKTKLDMSSSKATFLFLNQVRTHISFVRSSVDEAGGFAQKFYMDVRLYMRLAKKLTKKTDTIEGKVEVPYGADVKISATKNRYNRPYIEGVATILFGKGISNIMAYQYWLEKNGYIKIAGAYSKINIPELNIENVSLLGRVQTSKWVKDNVANIRKLVEDKGGFLLVTEEDTEQEN